MSEDKTPSATTQKSSVLEKIWVPIIVALISTIGVIWAAKLGDPPPPSPTQVSITSTTSVSLISLTPPILPTASVIQSTTQINIPVATALLGKSSGDANPFYVSQYYTPKQRMGDIGDIQKILGDRPDEFHFTYSTNGMGPQQWDFKCVDGKPNPEPARFAGVMFIDDNTGVGGTGSNNGYDLTGYRVIKWEARSIANDVKILFVFGGVTWVWGEQTCAKIDAPFPDSFPPLSFGPHTLTTDWQEFAFPIDKMPPDQLQHVVGVFGWIISWENNGISTAYDESGKIIGPQSPKTLEIEVRNIRYEK